MREVRRERWEGIREIKRGTGEFEKEKERESKPTRNREKTQSHA